MKKLLVLAAAAAIAAGCNVEEQQLQYVRVNTALCTFHAQDNAPLTIEVEASGEWDVVPQATWLKVGEKNPDVVRADCRKQRILHRPA